MSPPLQEKWKGLAHKMREWRAGSEPVYDNAAPTGEVVDVPKDWRTMRIEREEAADALDKAAELAAAAQRVEEAERAWWRRDGMRGSDSTRELRLHGAVLDLNEALTTTTSTDAPPSPAAGVLCGHDPACGYAEITHDNKPTKLCHDNDHSCYVAWTVSGERPPEVLTPFHKMGDVETPGAEGPPMAEVFTVLVARASGLRAEIATDGTVAWSDGLSPWTDPRDPVRRVRSALATGMYAPAPPPIPGHPGPFNKVRES